MTYEEALAYIASLAPRGWRLGLDRMDELVKRCGLEASIGAFGGPQFIHVAGTNGKGSVTAFLQSLLVEQGYRTGAFFSPFVYDPRERIQMGRDLISREDFAKVIADLTPAAESLSATSYGGVTEFEFKTAAGFRFWAEQKCDWVALEVGLGGRLDATNVVTPRACVIVSIGLDHIGVLGASHSEIAREKAGIIKPGVPVVVGQLPHEALREVEQVAYRERAPLWRLGNEIRLSEKRGVYRVQTPLGVFDGIRPGLSGVKQPHNMALAVAALEASGALRKRTAVALGTESTRIPGRFEHRVVRGKDVILDGAHNAESAEVVAQNLGRYFPGRKVLLVTGMVAGHDPVRFYSAFKAPVHRSFVVPIDFHRAVPVEKTLAALRQCGFQGESFESVEAGISRALKEADAGDIIVITGSFYLVGEAGNLLAFAASSTSGSPHQG